MTKQTIILYTAGAYGTFIEWLLTYLTDPELPESLPFGPTGNAHKFRGNFHDEYIPLSENTHSISRSHHVYFSIEEYLNKFDNIVSINFTSDSKFWILLNLISKTTLEEVDPEYLKLIKELQSENLNIIKNNDLEYFRTYLSESKSKDYLSAYDIDSVDDLARWQLREILSFWEFDKFLSLHFVERTTVKHDRIYNIDVRELTQNFTQTIKNLVKYLDLTVINDRLEQLDYIKDQWLSTQTFIDLDSTVDKYINNVIENLDYTIARPFGIFEEAWIQQKLREQGYEIKCHDLDQFPLNTKEMHKLIYDYSTDTERA